MRALLASALGLTLIVATTVDLKTRRLPDGCALVVALSGATLAVLRASQAILTGVIAMVAAALCLMALRRVNQARQGDPGLGLGDVKLIAALALWLGAATPWMVVIACLLGLVAVPFLLGADRKIPFGPMIAIAAWSVGVALERGITPWRL
jgi:leader peptidase (prepilin peptidase)/N-methyltransferase